MGAQLQSLAAQSAAQPNTGYNTTAGANFNYTAPSTPYWGTYINTPALGSKPQATTTTTTTPTTTTSGQYRDYENNQNGRGKESRGGQVYYDSQKGQYYTLNGTEGSAIASAGKNRTYIGTSPTGTGTSSTAGMSALQDYGTYIPPSMMPNVNAYLLSPDALVNAGQQAGLTSSGAARFTGTGLLAK